MSLLKSIATGKQFAPPRLLLYGPEGIGKSSLAAQTPNPIFIQTEDGLGQIDCHRFPLAERLEQVMESLHSLASDDHSYQTVVIDSLDWFERLIWDRVCQDFGVRNIEKADGGYGKGFTHALTYWRMFVDKLKSLQQTKQMLVMLLAHAKVERFEDPESAAYDRYSPRLHKHAGALLTEWVDAVLFATRRIRVQREEAGFSRERGVALAIGKDGGERLLKTVGGPSCVAKNRYSLPAELPLEWPAIYAAIVASRKPTTAVS